MARITQVKGLGTAPRKPSCLAQGPTVTQPSLLGDQSHSTPTLASPKAHELGKHLKLLSLGEQEALGHKENPRDNIQKGELHSQKSLIKKKLKTGPWCKGHPQAHKYTETVLNALNSAQEQLRKKFLESQIHSLITFFWG